MELPNQKWFNLREFVTSVTLSKIPSDLTNKMSRIKEKAEQRKLAAKLEARKLEMRKKGTPMSARKRRHNAIVSVYLRSAAKL